MVVPILHHIQHLFIKLSNEFQIWELNIGSETLVPAEYMYLLYRARMEKSFPVRQTQLFSIL